MGGGRGGRGQAGPGLVSARFARAWQGQGAEAGPGLIPGPCVPGPYLVVNYNIFGRQKYCWARNKSYFLPIIVTFDRIH